MPAIVEAVPHAHLDVWGEGPDLERLRAQAARLGVADQVRFLGVARIAMCPA